LAAELRHVSEMTTARRIFAAPPIRVRFASFLIKRFGKWREPSANCAIDWRMNIKKFAIGGILLGLTLGMFPVFAQVSYEPYTLDM
jgi:hypothetical protein